MRSSSILLVLIYATIATAQFVFSDQVNLGLQAFAHSGPSHLRKFGISIFNNDNGDGTANSLTNIRYSLIPIGFNVLDARGNALSPSKLTADLGVNINTQTNWWIVFYVDVSQVDAGNFISVSVSYKKNGVHSSIPALGAFALDSSAVVSKNVVDVEDESSAFFDQRTTYASFKPTGINPWSADQDVPTSEAYNVQTYGSILYNVTWNASSVNTNEIVSIGYPPAGNIYTSIPANHLQVNVFTLEASCGTPNPINMSYFICYQLISGANPSYCVSGFKGFYLDNCGTKKSVARQEVAVQSVSASSSSGVAVGIAGAAVAAIALVAAVVIVRRKTSTTANL